MITRTFTNEMKIHEGSLAIFTNKNVWKRIKFCFAFSRRIYEALTTIKKLNSKLKILAISSQGHINSETTKSEAPETRTQKDDEKYHYELRNLSKELKEVKEENYKITEMLISIGQVIPQINNAICNSQIKQNNDILDGLTNRHKVLKYSD